MNFPQILQGLSGIIMLIVPCIVISRVLKNEIKPNATSFLIRSVTAIANLVTYMIMTNHDMLKLVIIFSAMVSLIAIFLACVCKNGMGRLTWVECTSLILGSIIMIFWIYSGKNTATNMLLQSIITLAYWPVIDGVTKKRNNEIPLPWALASTAYLFALTGLLISGSSFVSMVNPIIGVITNVLTTVVVIVANKKAQP